MWERGVRERTRDEGQVRNCGEGCNKEEGVLGRHEPEGSRRGGLGGGRARPLVNYMTGRRRLCRVRPHVLSDADTSRL